MIYIRLLVGLWCVMAAVCSGLCAFSRESPYATWLRHICAANMIVMAMCVYLVLFETGGTACP